MTSLYLYSIFLSLHIYFNIEVASECKNVLQNFLPTIGRIVNITSINGRYTLPGSSPYNATKYALECVSDTLRMEIAKFGVKVAIIEPGMFGGSTNVHAEANVSIVELQWLKH